MYFVHTALMGTLLMLEKHEGAVHSTDHTLRSMPRLLKQIKSTSSAPCILGKKEKTCLLQREYYMVGVGGKK